MASKTSNVKLGICQITLDGVDLGYTLGGVEVDITTNTHPVVTDRFGESLVTEYITKRNITISAPLAETTLVNLEKIMPGATLHVNGQAQQIVATCGTGINLAAIAKPIRLHPQALPANDDSEDFYFYKAATAGSLSYTYKHDNVRVFATTFICYPSQENGGLVFSYGNADQLVNQLTDSLSSPLTDSLGSPLTSL